MLGHLREQLFQDFAARDLILVGLVERIGGGEQRERIEDLRLAVVGIALRDLLHLRRVSPRARRMVELVGIGVERRQRVDVIRLARRFARYRPRLLDRVEPFLEIVGPRRRPQLVPHAHGHSPIAHRALGVGFTQRGELLERLPVPE